MKKKSKTESVDPPRRPFGLLGGIVIGGFIFFFMLLPGGLITGHAIKDLMQQLSDSAALTVLTATLMAILLGSLLFFTGCLLLYRIAKPAPRTTEAL